MVFGLVMFFGFALCFLFLGQHDKFKRAAMVALSSYVKDSDLEQMRRDFRGTKVARGTSAYGADLTRLLLHPF